MIPTSDLHVVETRPLVPPSAVHREMPITARSASTVQQARERIKAILHAGDRQLGRIVGPCSVHDVDAARDYADAIHKAQCRYHDELEVVMRVYRETAHHRGLEGDDQRSPSRWQLRHQHRPAPRPRPVAPSGRDGAARGHGGAGLRWFPSTWPIWISWTAIAARTTESQTHREMASGQSMPIGFKNGTDGSAATAINAMEASAKPHHFLGNNHEGQAAIVSTTGNPDGHPCSGEARPAPTTTGRRWRRRPPCWSAKDCHRG